MGGRKAAGGRVLVLFADRAAHAGAKRLLRSPAFSGRPVTQAGSHRHFETLVESGAHGIALLVLSGRGGAGRRLADLVERSSKSAAVVVAGVADDPLGRDLLIAGACEVTGETTSGPGNADLARALARAARTGRALACVARYDPRWPLSQQLGAGPDLERVIRLIDRAAGSRAPILVSGEAGTGKSIVARAVHAHARGARREGPFLMGVLSGAGGGDLAGTLYGTARRPGLFELAHGGTVYLEDVEILPALDQTRLLDLLGRGAEARITRADGSQEAPADVRVIAGTSASLTDEVRRGRFLRRLYDRLSVLPIDLIPLRERVSEIAALATEMIDRSAGRRGVSIVGLSPGAMDRLRCHGWPGNLRELQRCLEAAVSRSAGPLIEEEDLMGLKGHRGAGQGRAGRRRAGALEIVVCLDESLPLTEISRRATAAAEIAAIRRALERSGGNVSHAARALGVSRTWIQRRMRRYRLKARSS